MIPTVLADKVVMRRALLLALMVATPWSRVSTSDPDPPAEVRRLLDDGRFMEAQSRARILLETADRNPSADPVGVAAILEPLVTAMASGLDCRDECAAMARRAVALREAAAGGEAPSVASAFVPLGMALERQGDFPAALDAFRRAVTLRDRAALPRDPLLVDALTQWGALLARTSRYAESRRVLERAVRLAEERLGPETAGLARALHKRAVLSFNQGNMKGAREDIDRTLAIRQRILRPDHADTAAAVGLLAMIDTASGDYAAARPRFEAWVDLLTRSYGPDSPLLGPAHYNLALFLMDIGDLAGARPHMERAYEITVRQVGPDHPDASGSGHGELMMEMGDYPAARASLERSLRVREASFGPEADVVGYSALSLGDLLLRMGDLETAERDARRAVAIFEKNHGARSALVADALIPLALIRERKGEDQDALALFQRAHDIDLASLGPDHPHTASVLGHLARMRLKRGARGRALDESLAAIAALRGSLARTARGLTERAALGYAATLHALFDVPCTVLAGGPPDGGPAGGPSASCAPADVLRLWNAVVRSRALVLDEMAARHRTVLDHESAEVRSLAARLEEARTALAHALSADDPGETGDAYRDRLRGLTETKDRAEGALADRSAVFRREIAARDVGIRGVLRSLPPGAALVSFVRYEDVAAGPSYLALVHGAGEGPAALVPLGPATALEERVRVWRQEVSAMPRNPEDETRYLDAARALRRIAWDPLTPHLRAATLLLVVPDGALSLVNFAALPSDDGRYLAEGALRIHQLSAERDAVLPAALPEGRGLLLVGDPDFQAQETRVASARARGPETASDTSSGADPVYRGIRSACGDFRSLTFPPLPGAAAETGEIAALWREGAAASSSGETVLLLTGGAASEEAFKRAAPRRRILHLATHGFFVQDHCDSVLDRAGDDWMPRVSRGPRLTLTLENPLLLSGLALAGANRRETAARSGEDDGILTAEEIASLDLRGVEWALLSACGTGLGPSQTGEGVLGLRRTFQVAGARTVLMSLWDVDDQATRDWMRHLYESRLRGRSTVESLRDASIAVLSARRSAGVSTHPFTWGAFVAAGDWR
jgi:CHAT domain-containing protein/tetratricopeptide (TPR) repeat protein